MSVFLILLQIWFCYSDTVFNKIRSWAKTQGVIMTMTSCVGVKPRFGGELGIRTLGGLLHTAFRVLHHRPLGQLSIKFISTSASGRFLENGEMWWREKLKILNFKFIKAAINWISHLLVFKTSGRFRYQPVTTSSILLHKSYCKISYTCQFTSVYSMDIAIAIKLYNSNFQLSTKRIRHQITLQNQSVYINH